MPITYGSVCSGIEAATQAWHPLGMRAVWFAEIEPFPSAVLAHHYPDVPNHGDMTKLAALVLAGKIPAPDVLVGGTPCQAFSVAGMREGLTDPRGALTIKYVELADAVDYVRAGQRKPASVIVWENVPGVLSDKGNAFGCFLGALAGEDCELQPPGKKWQDAGCVYGPKRTIAWRVLDAQYFGLAQRRRRVFVVASARDGFDPTEVLFEREGVRRDTAPCRIQVQDVTGTASFGSQFHGEPVAALTARGVGTCGADDNQVQAGHLLVFGGNDTRGPIDVAPAQNACASASGRMDFESEAFVVHGTQDPYVQSDQAHTHSRNNGQENVLYCREVAQTGTSNYGEQLDNTNSALGPNVETHAIQAGTMRANPASEPDGVGVQADYAYTLEVRAEVQAIQAGSAVRRLTPVECERLQGMADDYTLIPWRGKPAEECPDGPRYKAIGNSKAVTVVRWIGRRLLQQL
ncbi:DNA (cytosine-5-)-methyltransferase [Pseudomonas synxantha]|uniref:DNA (cytosine-5-)-methyltransferase n=1 Tax=Pseudomonas synxantha TaxID=47883 RepID=A0A5D3GII5_9PSED|nr:DNA (cytosine-5-)-methyltransferase [Pseudomonas synxantha]TYK60194.1 DNA cytosine methyltransferase [Pseudomonas synxantha]